MDPNEEHESGFALENLTQSPIDQTMHPVLSGVDEMEYGKVIVLMKYLNMKSTESGRRDRSLLKDYLYKRNWRGSYEDKIQDTVNKTMKKYVAEKNRLHDSYLEIEKMARTDAFKRELGPILEERFKTYMEQLKKRITKLRTDEIEICIIGWTCAGKSTFFNVLLGEDIMPTNVLPDTPCLVRLHNSQARKIQFVAEGKTLTVHLKDDLRDVKCKLKEILDQKCGSDQTLEVVDLYWPIPRLHEKVVFVDTPGIGEKNTLTKQVLKHVPNAAGYICIINSGDGGGILEGGIVHLFKAIADRDGQNKNNLGNVLFICNKWDTIERQDRETVSENTRRKLKPYFGVVEDWQIIHFSASVELQLMQLRASPTDDFLKILTGLETLMSRTVKSIFKDFFGWIKNVILKSICIIDNKMSLCSLSNAERIEITTMTAKVLEDTKIKLESNSKKIERMVDTKKSEIIKDLQEYLKSSRVQQRAGNWKFTDLKEKSSEIVLERIHVLISDWAEKDEGVLKKAIADIEKECREFAINIQTCLSSIHEVKMDFCPEDTVKVNIERLRDFTRMYLKGAVLTTIGTTLTIFTVAEEIAFVTLGSALGLMSFGIALSIGGLIGIVRKKSELTKLTSETLEKVSSNESTGNIINTLFEFPFKKWIEQFRSTKQCEIASQQKLVQELSADVQFATDHLSTLASLFHELNICLMHLEKIDVEYYSDDSVSCECLSIDSSAVSATEMFHLHDVANLVDGKTFTLQVIHPRYSGFQLLAIPELKKMKHTNFMRPEAVVYSTSVPEEMKACGCSIDSLRLLIQKSIGDLEQYVFSNQSMQGSYSGESTEDFFQKMTLGIANGLSYVHELGFVHGHLQLSSILLAEDLTPKLCDINILPTIQERNHSICIFHTAPEVIGGEKYGPKADIYSLGILLWELWYGRHTPPEMNLTEKSVCLGVRPKFAEKYPKKGWISMIQSCWTGSPDRRPSAAACVQTSLNVV